MPLHLHTIFRVDLQRFANVPIAARQLHAPFLVFAMLQKLCAVGRAAAMELVREEHVRAKLCQWSAPSGTPIRGRPPFILVGRRIRLAALGYHTSRV